MIPAGSLPRSVGRIASCASWIFCSVPAGFVAGVATEPAKRKRGYAGDLICEQLKAQGIESALLDLGGNIHAIGSDPDGGAWRLGVRDPDGEGNIAILELCDMAAQNAEFPSIVDALDNRFLAPKNMIEEIFDA